jgi:RNA polymerase sigma-54 factor
MNLNQNLQLTQTQKLAITTELKQSLSILNMNVIELEEEIKREAEENPIIEIDKSNEIDWEKYIKNMDNSYNYDNPSYNNENEDYNLENMVRHYDSLYDHLKFQMGLYKLNNEEREVCEYIIDSIDENGYLILDTDEIVKQLNVEEDLVRKSINTVQQLEPSGVGARNLRECLLIQLENMNIRDELLESIIKNDLESLALKKYKEISKKYKISLDQCVQLAHKIQKLEPKPGLKYSYIKNSYIVPDIIVEKIDNEYVVYTNEKDTYNIKINNFYKEVLKNSQKDNEAKEFIKDKLNSALNLIKNIENRKSTILKISKELLNQQKDFFEKGPKYLRPLILKDIAENIGYHESTISRGVNGKYILTPYGLFELKYFFSSGLYNKDEGTASTSIKKFIEEIIKGENKKRPYSDDKISYILEQKGLKIARRTIAKYREELNIPSSSKRKEY